MAMGAKQLGGWQGRGTEGALLGKVSGARRAGGRPCQLSLCGAGRKGGKKETTASERIQSEAAGASEPWLIRASCEPPLLWSTRQVFCWSREERATRRVRAFVADRAGGGRAGSTLAVPADTQPSQTPHRLAFGVSSVHSRSLAGPNRWVPKERDRAAVLPTPMPEQGTPRSQACVCQGVIPRAAAGDGTSALSCLDRQPDSRLAGGTFGPRLPLPNRRRQHGGQPSPLLSPGPLPFSRPSDGFALSVCFWREERGSCQPQLPSPSWD